MGKRKITKPSLAKREREALREKGQFWTPDWIADAMVEYVLSDGGESLFDPAVGQGAFFRAAKRLGEARGTAITLLGTEIDPAALNQALESGLSREDTSHVQIRDFVLHPPKGPIKSIVANPPYIRHHRLGLSVKERLKAFGKELIGTALDGRAGLHVYFLLRALQLLDEGGRLAFIVPADTCEGVSAPVLWQWISRHFRIEIVVTFDPAASPFPQVDTNPVILMISNERPAAEILWARCHKACTSDLRQWIREGDKAGGSGALTVFQRQLPEALATGLTRPPSKQKVSRLALGDFATVMRGIATGANDFFFLTPEKAGQLGIPLEFFATAIGRTRDVSGEEITQETIDALRLRGRPTLLLSLDARPPTEYPPAVHDYLKHGEEIGLPKRPLISQRQPWYKMETRTPPPILFAYLGRRNSRFLFNRAGVLPLTGFLCVYPRQNDPEFVAKLWRILCDPETVANLALIGKSYGAGAVKVEPRALERLPLPEQLVTGSGLLRWKAMRQQELPFAASQVK